MCKLRMSKVRDVKTPSRGTVMSAGTDFYVPKFRSSFIEAFEKRNELAIASNEIYVDKSARVIILSPRAQVQIPSGIKVDQMSLSNVQLEASNKSSVSTKKGLVVTAGTIDADYQGELHLCMYNSSSKLAFINEDDKITQFVLRTVQLPTVELVAEEDLFSEVTERGSGGFGSTDIKDVQLKK